MNPSTHASTPAPEESASGSIKTLLQELRAEGALLVQKEAELAKAELAEKASSLGTHVTRISIGGAIAYAGMIVALFGLGDLARALLINAGMDANAAGWVGRLGVGLIVALVGWMMFARAKKAVKTDSLVPEQTLRTLRENKQWMQTKLQHSHEPI